MALHSAVIENNSTTGLVVIQGTGPVTVTAAIALNTTTAAAYANLYDAATTASVTLGTTVPRWTVASAASSVGSAHGMPCDGVVFLNGIVAASVTAIMGTTTASQHLRIAVR